MLQNSLEETPKRDPWGMWCGLLLQMFLTDDANQMTYLTMSTVVKLKICTRTFSHTSWPLPTEWQAKKPINIPYSQNTNCQPI